MGASLNEQCRVNEEGLRIVKFCWEGKRVTRGNAGEVILPFEEVTANYVPAAAVIRRWRALAGMIGRKGCVGGLLRLK